MHLLHQEGTVSRLAPLAENDVWRDGMLEAIRSAQEYALVGSRQPCRAMNYRGTIAWHEALSAVGTVLLNLGWTYKPDVQPTFIAPEGVFPGGLEMFILHGGCEGSAIVTRRRGQRTIDKLKANARQFTLDLDYADEMPKVAPGTLFACLVMKVTSEGVWVYLALGRPMGEETRIPCEEIILLNEEPLILESITDPGPQNQPTVAPVAPVIEELQKTG